MMQLKHFKQKEIIIWKKKNATNEITFVFRKQSVFSQAEISS